MITPLQNLKLLGIISLKHLMSQVLVLRLKALDDLKHFWKIEFRRSIWFDNCYWQATKHWRPREFKGVSFMILLIDIWVEKYILLNMHIRFHILFKFISCSYGWGSRIYFHLVSLEKIKLSNIQMSILSKEAVI